MPFHPGTTLGPYAVIHGAMVVLAVASVGGLGAWGYFEARSRAWIPYNEYDIRAEGQLRVGDIAPDFSLANLNGAAAKLSDFYRDKPLVQPTPNVRGTDGDRSRVRRRHGREDNLPG